MQRKPPLPPPQSLSKLHSGDLGAGSSMHEPLSQICPVGHLPVLHERAQARFTHFWLAPHCVSSVQSARAMPQLAASLGRQRPEIQLSPVLQAVLSLQAASHLPRLQTRSLPHAASLSQLATSGGVGLTGSPATG